MTEKPKLFDHTVPKRDLAGDSLIQVSRPLPQPGSDVEGRSRCQDGAALAIMITDFCKHKCHDCIYRDIVQAPCHVLDPAVLKAQAEHLGGFRAVFLSGGEPTTHPQLDEIVRVVKERLKPAYHYLATSGENIGRWVDVARTLTFVNLTRHQGWTTAYRLLQVSGAGVVLNTRRHWPWPQGERERILPCYRSGVRVLRDGKLYPCPGGPGIAGAAYVEVGPGCQEAVRHVARPCAACPFGVVS